MGDWLIILPIFAVGFACGACWMRARQRDTYNRRALRISGEVDRALSQINAGRSRNVAAVNHIRVIERPGHSAINRVDARSARTFQEAQP